MAYITVDFKKVVNHLFQIWFHYGRKRMYQEENETIRIAPEHNSTLETFLYATKKDLTVHQSDIYTFKYPVKTLNDQCKLVSEEVKKTTESTKQ